MPRSLGDRCSADPQKGVLWSRVNRDRIPAEFPWFNVARIGVSSSIQEDTNWLSYNPYSGQSREILSCAGVEDIEKSWTWTLKGWIKTILKMTTVEYHRWPQLQRVARHGLYSILTSGWSWHIRPIVFGGGHAEYVFSLSEFEYTKFKYSSLCLWQSRTPNHALMNHMPSLPRRIIWPRFPNPDWVDTYGWSTIDHEGTCIDHVEVS